MLWGQIFLKISIQWIILLGILSYGVESSNILFLFGGGSYSHKISVWPLVMSLSDKGHNLTFVSSNEKQPRVKPSIRDIAPSFMKKIFSGIYEVDRFRDRREGKETIFNSYEAESIKLCELTWNSESDPVFDGLLTHEIGTFDLAIINAVYGECGFYIAHHLKIPKYIIFVSTIIQPWFYRNFGIPLEASWIPDYLSQVEPPLNFWKRLHMLYNTLSMSSLSTHFENSMESIYKRKFPHVDVPKFIDLYRKSGLVLVNSHYTTDFARSLPPMFIDIGGMACWEPMGVLPKNFKVFMNRWENGVMIISFGSTIMVNTLSEEFISIFFNMMRKYDKVGFIWRWDGPLPENSPSNLLSSKWLPQKEILREKSVRGLISHCGINSIAEATHSGVPIIAMPLFADQDINAFRIVAQQIGVKVEAAHFSQDMLNSAVLKILNTPTYKRNMEARSALFRDRPDPKKTALEAVEFVLKHDDLSPLRPMEQNQPIWIRQHIDIYFCVFLVILTLNITFPYILYRVIRKYK